MKIETHEISLKSQGNADVIDLSSQIQSCLGKSDIENGMALVFVVGSTGAITTTEFEPGLAKHDLKALYEQLAPEDGRYVHEETWGDDNGHSHVRASLTGPSLTVPLVDGHLTLGTWQQIILLDFDTRPRSRKVILQLMGE